MTPEAFSSSMEFRLLSDREREVTLVVIEGKSLEEAVRSVYPRSRNQRLLAARMRNNERVLNALRLWFGQSSIPIPTAKEEAIRELKADIRKLRGVARVQARRLLLTLQGVIE